MPAAIAGRKDLKVLIVATEKELRATPDLTDCRRSLVVDLLKEFDVRFAVIDLSGLLSESSGG